MGILSLPGKGGSSPRKSLRPPTGYLPGYLKIFLCSNFGEKEWCGGWRGPSSEHLSPIKSFRIALEKHLIGDEATSTDLMLDS